MSNRTQYLIALTAVALSIPAQAAVKPHHLFTDNAVLQCDARVPVWGEARDGEKITVKFAGQKASTTAKNGRWMIWMKPVKAGGPFTMTIAGENTVTITNVLVGEVWVCSGQSNMWWPLDETENGTQAAAGATDAHLRLFTVPMLAKDEPQSNVEAAWKMCDSNTVTRFSAVGYYFGRDLRKARNVPVGLIHSSVGGTPAEAWTSRKIIETNPQLGDVMKDYQYNLQAYPEKLEKYRKDEVELLRKWESNVEQAKRDGKQPPKKPSAPTSPAESMGRPSGLYNAMIAPLLPYALRGVIWYQGESNAGNPKRYEILFPAMIRSWRDDWGQGEFPFLFVQIAPFGKIGPEIRDAQLNCWKNTSRTAMVVTTDVGDETNIHPKRKEPVGARLALAARAIAYGEKIEYSGPLFDAMKIEGNRAILSFTHTGGGLMARDGELKGFTVAGEDMKFVQAAATIAGDKVIVSSGEVAKPVAVRYGWANMPDVNLFNKEGLPASPFRTSAE